MKHFTLNCCITCASVANMPNNKKETQQDRKKKKKNRKMTQWMSQFVNPPESGPGQPGGDKLVQRQHQPTPTYPPHKGYIKTVS